MEIFNNVLFDIVLTAIIALFVGGGLVIFAQKRKQNPGNDVWTDIIAVLALLRPQIIEVIAEISEAKEAAEEGYEAMETYIIDELYGRIQAWEFLSDAEKSLISKEVLASFLRPELMKLWNQKVKQALEANVQEAVESQEVQK